MPKDKKWQKKTKPTYLKYVIRIKKKTIIIICELEYKIYWTERNHNCNRECWHRNEEKVTFFERSKPKFVVLFFIWLLELSITIIYTYIYRTRNIFWNICFDFNLTWKLRARKVYEHLGNNKINYIKENI